MDGESQPAALERLTREGLGEAIRTRRLALGLTQEDLATMLEVTVTTVGRWERGETGIQRRLRDRVAEVLELSNVDAGAYGNVVPLGREPATATPLQIPEARRSAMAAEYVDALVVGLRDGHAVSPEWRAVADQAATLLGLNTRNRGPIL